MTTKIKKIIYLIAFTVLGFLAGLLAAFLIELWYINLLLSDFSRYSYGLSWSDLAQFSNFFLIILLFATTLWGYSSGKYWWHQIYELKRFRRKHWFLF